jgi:hypothetical protein
LARSPAAVPAAAWHRAAAGSLRRNTRPS